MDRLRDSLVSPVSSGPAPPAGRDGDDVSCYFLRLNGDPPPPGLPPETSSLQVACILTGVACFAEVLSRQTRFGAALSSSLISFLTAAAVSNAFPELLPAHSPVYDAAWSVLVPVILVLLITSVVLDTPGPAVAASSTPYEDASSSWASSQKCPHHSSETTPACKGADAPCSSTSSDTGSNQLLVGDFSSLSLSSISASSPSHSVSQSPPLSPSELSRESASTNTDGARCFQTVGVAFTLGAAATLLSVAATYHIVLILISSYSWCLGAFHLTRHVAAMCAACTAATYIGGSINFYAVAKALGVPGHILGGLSAADLFLSGIYTAVLSVLARHVAFLQHIFPDRGPRRLDARPTHTRSASNKDLPVDASAPPFAIAEAQPSPALRIASIAFCAAYATLVKWLAYGLELSLYRITCVPLQGADTLAVSLVAFACARIVESSLRREKKQNVKMAAVWRDFCEQDAERRNLFELIEEAARSFGAVANAAQALFFAAIGAGARLSDVATIGPAIFGFTLASLVGHLFAHLILCHLFNTLARQKNPSYAIPLDDCLVASEANIGGPGTAATLAGTMLRRPDLIMPAVVWGTVGYLVATSIGIELFSFLTAS
ncbi:hypothetical protein BESB_062080 [Besnoitia besnoiti]|uniref:Transmembrane protein n=1 Tax=Besnoitia besnoiti TaxID=94643 RepID=A0A2A9MGC2_BESBE|nr:hypothetical protein BESB_062080 [Besnoitia besnoiti]PFH35321.1 hypothetical protein BESB_062080 [Besnoitia besnoiti]